MDRASQARIDIGSTLPALGRELLSPMQLGVRKREDWRSKLFSQALSAKACLGRLRKLFSNRVIHTFGAGCPGAYSRSRARHSLDSSRDGIRDSIGPAQLVEQGLEQFVLLLGDFEQGVVLLTGRPVELVQQLGNQAVKKARVRVWVLVLSFVCDL